MAGNRHPLGKLIDLRRSPWGAAVMLLGATAGCGPAPISQPDIGAVELHIVNGEPDPADDAVVALLGWGQPFCTGTVVSPTVVLTAAHCLHPDMGVPPISQIEVFFGSNVWSGGTTIDAVEGEYHPSWSINDPQGDYDVGVLRLASTAPAGPVPLGTQAFSPSTVGEPVRLVGFGVTYSGGNDAGIKREGSSYVDDYSSLQFTMPLSPSGTCSGDSGGAALMTEGGLEVVAGIHSMSDCQSIAIDERVDAHVNSFINPFIGADPVPDCGADGLCASNCPDVDPDCPCAQDGFCTDACLNASLDQDCLPACAADGTCMPGCPEPDPDCDDEPCQADGYCDPSCDAAPDCPPPDGCEADGECADDCEGTDPDCLVAGGMDDERYRGDTVSCAATSRADGRAAWSSLAGLAAVLVLARRRRLPRAELDRG